MATVSVLLPVYNCAPYLDEALLSIRQQTYRDLQIVCVNDGSTDGTPEILKKHAAEDDRIQVLEQENAGVGAASRKAEGACVGEFIARMDGDDVSHPERIERQIRFLESNPEVGAVGSWADAICPQGILFEEILPPIEHSEIERALLNGNGQAVVHPTMTLRTALLRDVGGYNAERKMAEDVDLYLRLLACSQVVNLPEKLLKYRKHLTTSNILQKRLLAETFRMQIDAVRAERGLEPLPESRWNNEVPDVVMCLHIWAENALRRGFPRAGIAYAVESLRRKPISRNGWRCLWRGVLGSMAAKEQPSDGWAATFATTRK